MDEEKLRLECIKIAAALYQGRDPEKTTALAEKFFTFVTGPKAT